MTLKKQLLLFILFIPFFAQTQITSPDSMAKAFVASVKANDLEGFKALYPNRPTMWLIMKDMVTRAGAKEPDSADMEQMLDNMAGEYSSMFEKVLRKLKAKGINARMIGFKKAKLTAYKEDEIPGENNTMYKGNITIVANGKDYLLEVSEILEYNGAYYGIELDSVKPAVAVTSKKPVAKRN